MLDVFRTADHAGQIFIPHRLTCVPFGDSRLFTLGSQNYDITIRVQSRLREAAASASPDTIPIHINAATCFGNSLSMQLVGRVADFVPAPLIPQTAEFCCRPIFSFYRTSDCFGLEGYVIFVHRLPSTNR